MLLKNCSLTATNISINDDDDDDDDGDDISITGPHKAHEVSYFCGEVQNPIRSSGDGRADRCQLVSEDRCERLRHTQSRSLAAETVAAGCGDAYKDGAMTTPQPEPPPRLREAAVGSPLAKTHRAHAHRLIDTPPGIGGRDAAIRRRSER